MTTYINYWNLDTSDTDHKYTKMNQATPGDLSGVMVRRGWCNTVKSQLNNGVVGNIIPINAGEVVIDAYCRIITGDATSNAAIDVGFAGGTEVSSDGAVATANSILANGNFVPIHFAAANAVTIMPNNAVNIDAGVFEVVAMVTKSFDKS